jgi:hypothetical protein
MDGASEASAAVSTKESAVRTVLPPPPAALMRRISKGSLSLAGAAAHAAALPAPFFSFFQQFPGNF